MADIAYIPIRQLHPHPDNPRKELGDLSELAASIKENGVYQNLTVIPGHYLGKQEYIARCIADGGDVSAAEAAWTPKAAPDAAEIHSIKSDLSRALQEVSANATACALSGGIPEKAKASPPAGAEPKRVQRKEIHKGTAYGVLRLRCPKCGDVFGRFLREPSASVTCRCGGEVQLDNLTRYEFTCPCCDFEAHGRTNLEDPEITVPCKCGNPVTMKWDRNKRMYHE